MALPDIIEQETNRMTLMTIDQRRENSKKRAFNTIYEGLIFQKYCKSTLLK